MVTFDLATFDLSQLPTAEDQDFEFKSSRTPLKSLKHKMAQAASGFANSGGGCFVAGVDGKGDADGGVPVQVERADLKDWADQIVHSVAPRPEYQTKVFTETCGRGTIECGRAVLIVAIKESYLGPHMAKDYHYYIRAGAHTLKAAHFLVEAIWAKRHFRKPRLTHLLRLKPTHPDIVELVILALTDAPAVDVQVDVQGSLETLRGGWKFSPLQIPVIDNDNPFYMDLTNLREAWESERTLTLQMTYRSLDGEEFTHNATIAIPRSIPQVVFSDPSADELSKIRRALESIDTKLPSAKPGSEIGPSLPP